MIASLRGQVTELGNRYAVIEVNNIGYKVFLSRQVMVTLPEIGESIKVFTYQNVKEEALDLYGFPTYEGLEFFETLMEIRGVGPKSALDISALGSLDKIKDRILKQDEKIFEGIPGIGAKKAMTIILELTGKIKMVGQKKGSADEAEDALTQLGFSKQQAKDALSKVPANIKDSGERIKLSLKSLGK